MRIPAAMSPDAMDSVTLTEADMNDPDLNAELAAVLGESVPSRPAAAARAPEHGSDSEAALRQQISAKKKLALQLRATDKPAAMQALREAKQLEAALQARPPPAAPPPAAAGAPAAAAARRVALEAAGARGAPGGPEHVTLSEADMHDPEVRGRGRGRGRVRVRVEGEGEGEGGG